MQQFLLVLVTLTVRLIQQVLDGSSAPPTPRDPPETPRHLLDGHGPSWFYNTAYDEHTSPDSQDDQRSFVARHSNVNLKGADKDNVSHPIPCVFGWLFPISLPMLAECLKFYCLRHGNNACN